MIQQNPGNINVRIGAALQAYEGAVIRGDVVGAANVLHGIIYRYASIYANTDWKKAYWGMPSLNDDPHQTHQAAFMALGDQLEVCLCLLRDNGVFARKPELEDGDSSILDQPVEAEAYLQTR